MTAETKGSNNLTVTPVNLLEIVELIGEAAALKLVEDYGGQTIRIPALRNVNVDHALTRCIGLESLTALAKADGGRWLYVAKCDQSLRVRRNREIVEKYSPPHNVPVAQLAKDYGLSDRQIWNILGSTAMDDKQEQLF